MNIWPKLQWTDDCQGKKDYDGAIVIVSTRYWPRGGSSTVFQGGHLVSDRHSPERQHVPPSAKSEILFGETILATRDFEAETEDDVKHVVEVWVKEQVAKIQGLLGTYPWGPGE